jgi:hypothetical protein
MSTPFCFTLHHVWSLVCANKTHHQLYQNNSTIASSLVPFIKSLQYSQVWKTPQDMWSLVFDITTSHPLTPLIYQTTISSCPLYYYITSLIRQISWLIFKSFQNRNKSSIPEHVSRVPTDCFAISTNLSIYSSIHLFPLSHLPISLSSNPIYINNYDNISSITNIYPNLKHASRVPTDCFAISTNISIYSTYQSNPHIPFVPLTYLSLF